MYLQRQLTAELSGQPQCSREARARGLVRSNELLAGLMGFALSIITFKHTKYKRKNADQYSGDDRTHERRPNISNESYSIGHEVRLLVMRPGNGGCGESNT